MWMTDYIRTVKNWFRENVETFPDVPDGTYDIEIEGKVDHVKIENGNINCCNY